MKVVLVRLPKLAEREGVVNVAMGNSAFRGADIARKRQLVEEKIAHLSQGKTAFGTSLTPSVVRRAVGEMRIRVSKELDGSQAVPSVDFLYPDLPAPRVAFGQGSATPSVRLEIGRAEMRSGSSNHLDVAQAGRIGRRQHRDFSVQRVTFGQGHTFPSVRREVGVAQARSSQSDSVAQVGECTWKLTSVRPTLQVEVQPGPLFVRLQKTVENSITHPTSVRASMGNGFYRGFATAQ